MGQYEKDKKELLEKIEQLEHKLKKAKQSGDKDDVDKYSRMSQKPQLSSSQRFDLRESAWKSTMAWGTTIDDVHAGGTASSASPTASCRTATRTSAGRRANPGIARTASTGRPWAA